MAAIRTDELPFSEIFKRFERSIRDKEHLVYGFLAYTLENINITQTLSNIDQWNGINAVTGDNTLLCYIDLSEYSDNMYFGRHKDEKKFQGLEPITPLKVDTTTNHLMYCSDLDELITALGYDKYNKMEYPFFLFFHLDRSGDILDTFMLSLKNKDATFIISRFQNLNKLLSKLNRSAYDSNTLFNLVKNGIEPDLFSILKEKVPLLNLLSRLFTIIS